MIEIKRSNCDLDLAGSLNISGNNEKKERKKHTQETHTQFYQTPSPRQTSLLADE